jgi:hypothetical protein
VSDRDGVKPKPVCQLEAEQLALAKSKAIKDVDEDMKLNKAPSGKWPRYCEMAWTVTRVLDGYVV